jgi:hypothetical protein
MGGSAPNIKAVLQPQVNSNAESAITWDLDPSLPVATAVAVAIAAVAYQCIGAVLRPQVNSNAESAAS